VNENETTVVDFGTWIGPTMIHHGSFSKRSIGVEADPVAFAIAEYNVQLNREHKSWGDRVRIDSGCVARPEDKGFMEMTAGRRPGMSMSGIGEKVKDSSSFKWFVECYTLPELFDHYWHIEKPYRDVMIKIDIESYECKLIPSFYDWLKDEEYLPKMFISFHPQIQHCTLDEYEGVLKVLRLYDHVLFHNKMEFENLHNNATGEEFQNLIGMMNSVVIYQDHHVENFLVAT
jgi:FkbM family methyltransferase